jgi:MYXO-CTERM domain-containing protein
LNEEENHVRKLVIGTTALLAVASAPVIVLAQDADPDVQRTAEAADREDRGEWGWLGLLGLAGLFGLKRRDRDEFATRERATGLR